MVGAGVPMLLDPRADRALVPPRDHRVEKALRTSPREIVLTEALELSHLDYEEFLAAYESMTLALSSHLRELVTFREAR